MGLPPEKPAFSRADYLAWENEQLDCRHEFIAGEVFAMVGARDCHNVIGGNLYMALRPHLKGSGCQAYTSDVKLMVEAADCVFYPDVFVTCEQPSDPLVKRDAVLVAEVLSPSTEAYDRGRKFAAYRLLPGLRDYLLLCTDAPRAELYRRNADQHWVLHDFAPGDELTLESIGLTLPVAALFEDAELAPEAPAPTAD